MAVPPGRPEFRTDIERALTQLSWSRGKYVDLFARLPWRVLTRKRGATFESIRDVHLHVLLAYAGWLYDYFGLRSMKPLYRRLARDAHPDVRSVATIRKMDRQVDAAVLRIARRLGPRELDRKRKLPWGDGLTGVVSPREVLWHLIEEDFLHHGEILCMLWQDDIEPPYTGVWWFEYDHNPARHQDLPYANPKIPRPSSGGYVKGRRPTR